MSSTPFLVFLFLPKLFRILRVKSWRHHEIWVNVRLPLPRPLLPADIGLHVTVRWAVLAGRRRKHSRTELLLLLSLPPQSGAVERSKVTSVTSHTEVIDCKVSCPSASASVQHNDRHLFNDGLLIAWGRERKQRRLPKAHTPFIGSHRVAARLATFQNAVNNLYLKFPYSTSTMSAQRCK